MMSLLDHPQEKVPLAVRIAEQPILATAAACSVKSSVSSTTSAEAVPYPTTPGLLLVTEPETRQATLPAAASPAAAASTSATIASVASSGAAPAAIPITASAPPSWNTAVSASTGVAGAAASYAIVAGTVASSSAAASSAVVTSAITSSVVVAGAAATAAAVAVGAAAVGAGALLMPSAAQQAPKVEVSAPSRTAAPSSVSKAAAAAAAEPETEERAVAGAAIGAEAASLEAGNEVISASTSDELQVKAENPVCVNHVLPTVAPPAIIDSVTSWLEVHQATEVERTPLFTRDEAANISAFASTTSASLLSASPLSKETLTVVSTEPIIAAELAAPSLEEKDTKAGDPSAFLSAASLTVAVRGNDSKAEVGNTERKPATSGGGTLALSGSLKESRWTRDEEGKWLAPSPELGPDLPAQPTQLIWRGSAAGGSVPAVSASTASALPEGVFGVIEPWWLQRRGSEERSAGSADVSTCSPVAVAAGGVRDLFVTVTDAPTTPEAAAVAKVLAGGAAISAAVSAASEKVADSSADSPATLPAAAVLKELVDVPRTPDSAPKPQQLLSDDSPAAAPTVLVSPISEKSTVAAALASALSPPVIASRAADHHAESSVAATSQDGAEAVAVPAVIESVKAWLQVHHEPAAASSSFDSPQHVPQDEVNAFALDDIGSDYPDSDSSVSSRGSRAGRQGRMAVPTIMGLPLPGQQVAAVNAFPLNDIRSDTMSESSVGSKRSLSQRGPTGAGQRPGAAMASFALDDVGSEYNSESSVSSRGRYGHVAVPTMVQQQLAAAQQMASFALNDVRSETSSIPSRSSKGGSRQGSQQQS